MKYNKSDLKAAQDKFMILKTQYEQKDYVDLIMHTRLLNLAEERVNAIQDYLDRKRERRLRRKQKRQGPSEAQKRMMAMEAKLKKLGTKQLVAKYKKIIDPDYDPEEPRSLTRAGLIEALVEMENY